MVTIFQFYFSWGGGGHAAERRELIWSPSVMKTRLFWKKPWVGRFHENLRLVYSDWHSSAFCRMPGARDLKLPKTPWVRRSDDSRFRGARGALIEDEKSHFSDISPTFLRHFSDPPFLRQLLF